MSKLIAFLKDVKVELSRVSWPTRRQTARYTLIVLAVSVVLGIYLGGLDFIYSRLLNLLI
jgi:preprotein translocase subunit SecE